jgi:uncharacterized protein YbjQ (UPF0145 family)
MYIAVITGDVIKSSNIKGDVSKFLHEIFTSLNYELKYLGAASEVDIIRGDSYQLLIRNPGKAIEACLHVILSTIVNGKEFFANPVLVRQSIGIGTFDYLGESPSDGNGEAFRYSGKRLDKMDAHNLISIKTSWNDSNLLFDVLSEYVSEHLQTLSWQQAQAIQLTLKNYTQKQIGEMLNISQIAVHKRLKAGGINTIQTLLNRFNEYIRLKITHA